ncbi:hypothetical protein Mal52_19120 [Symmachiella dynata]|uniref:DUF6881 domain-containing protein n=1 Tax=Symmachiella dynata TaxID=2527995 RepID=A0A517ZLT2_9PLAN|nr:hypothetical protein Mal52_19120 [Symmachiella dynata]
MSQARSYLRVEWVHDFATEPVMLYSELDDEMWELRKVEVFRNGTAGCADQNGRTGDTKLSKEPLPSIEEIGADPQFKPVEIGADEFEKIWTQYAS